MRQVRQELAPFSPAFRRALEGAGLEPRAIQRPADLARLAPLARADLAGAGPAHALAFDPRALRGAWPFARKLALAVGGARVRAALPRSYRPALRLETRGRAGEPLPVWYTAFDVEVARELGRRNLEILGLDPADSRVLTLTGGALDLASWHLREALTAAAVPSAHAPPPRGSRAAAALRALRALRPTALCGRPADLLRLARAARAAGVELDRLTLAVLLAEPADAALRGRIAAELCAAGAPDEPRLASAYGLAELRQLHVECPAPAAAPSGHHLFPDTVTAEALDGELLLTPLVGHGTALFRYRTGDRVAADPTWARCPACGRGLPRVGPIGARLDERLELQDGARLDLADLRAALDARSEVLEWQLAVRRAAGRPAGLTLRVALHAGARPLDAATLEALLPGAAPRLEVHPEAQLLDWLASPHEMWDRRLVDPDSTARP